MRVARVTAAVCAVLMMSSVWGQPDLYRVAVNGVRVEDYGRRITLGPDELLQNGQIVVTGLALPDGAPVDKVEVSFDGGASWQTARGKRAFSYAFMPDIGQTYNLNVRATDTEGATTELSVMDRAEITVVRQTAEQALWDLVYGVSQAYQDEDYREFLSYFSPDFYGSLDEIEQGIRDDFQLFDVLFLKPFIQKTTVTGARAEVPVRWTRTLGSAGVPTTGETVFVCQKTEGGWKIIAFRGNTLYSVSNPPPGTDENPFGQDSGDQQPMQPYSTGARAQLAAMLGAQNATRTSRRGTRFSISGDVVQALRSLSSEDRPLRVAQAPSNAAASAGPAEDEPQFSFRTNSRLSLDGRRVSGGAAFSVQPNETFLSETANFSFEGDVGRSGQRLLGSLGTRLTSFDQADGVEINSFLVQYNFDDRTYIGVGDLTPQFSDYSVAQQIRGFYGAVPIGDYDLSAVYQSGSRDVQALRLSRNYGDGLNLGLSFTSSELLGVSSNVWSLDATMPLPLHTLLQAELASEGGDVAWYARLRHRGERYRARLSFDSASSGFLTNMGNFVVAGRNNLNFRFELDLTKNLVGEFRYRRFVDHLTGNSRRTDEPQLSVTLLPSQDASRRTATLTYYIRGRKDVISTVDDNRRSIVLDYAQRLANGRIALSLGDEQERDAVRAANRLGRQLFNLTYQRDLNPTLGMVVRYRYQKEDGDAVVAPATTPTDVKFETYGLSFNKSIGGNLTAGLGIRYDARDINTDTTGYRRISPTFDLGYRFPNGTAVSLSYNRIYFNSYTAANNHDDELFAIVVSNTF